MPKNTMDKADIYYTQLNNEIKNYKYYELLKASVNLQNNYNVCCCYSRKQQQQQKQRSDSSSDNLKHSYCCCHCCKENIKRLTKYLYMYYSYVAHAITAAASIAAVAAAETANSAHEHLKFVYENSHASSLTAYDDSIFNNTFILATSDSTSSALSSQSSAASYTAFNDSATTYAVASTPLNSPSVSSVSPALSSSATIVSSPSSAFNEVSGINVSLTSSDDWSHFYDLMLSWQGICLIAVFCTFIVITIIGNTLVILAVITTRRLKTVTNCFVMSLAVADLLVGIFVMPPAVAVHLIGSWQLGWVLCDIWISLDVLLCTASILSLCAISVDRYLAVTQPLTYSRKRRSKRLALLMILIVWVLALAITCPPILGWYEPGRRDLNECRYNQNEGYVIFSAMGSFFIPMAVMIYVYARISCVIANRHDNMTDISVHNKKFKRYTAADIDNELDPDLSEFDLSSGHKKQQAARTLSNQTLAKDLQEIMATDNEIVGGGNTTQCHSLLVLQQQKVASPTSGKNGCYELKRPSSLKRTSTASSVITTMTSSTCTGTGTAANATAMENPWTFTPISPAPQQQQQHQHHHQQYQQHAHPNKHMRTHSIRHHQHYLSAATTTIPSPNTTINTTTTNAANNTLNTPDAIVTGSGSSILRHPATPQLRSHHHHHHQYTSKSLSNRISSLKKETKTTQTLSIVVGGFIACWLPFFINYLITPFLDEDQVSSTLAKVLTWLGWFNSAINPFIYAFYSVDFRAAFWRLTCKRFFSSSTKPQFPTNTMSIRR